MSAKPILHQIDTSCEVTTLRRIDRMRERLSKRIPSADANAAYSSDQWMLLGVLTAVFGCGVLTLDAQPILGAIAMALASFGIGGVVVSLLQQRHHRSMASRIARMSDRFECGIEELNDLQWELREREARYRDLLDCQGEFILRRDTAGRLTYVNQTVCTAFNLQADIALGQLFCPDILDGETRPRVTDSDDDAVYLQCLETAKGPRWIEWRDCLICNGAEGAEVQSVGHDVTEQYETQRELAEARDQAEAANLSLIHI